MFKRFLPNKVTHVFIAFGSLFNGFLSFSVPLVVLKLIAPTVKRLNGKTNELLTLATLVTCNSAVFSNFFACFDDSTVFPRVLPIGARLATVRGPRSFVLRPCFVITVPPLVSIVATLLLSFAVKLNLSCVGKRALHRSFSSFRGVVAGLVRTIVVPLLPLRVFNVFLGVAIDKRIVNIVAVFLGIVVIVFILRILLLLVRFAVTNDVDKGGPLQLLGGVLPTCTATLKARSSTTAVPMALTRTIGGKIQRGVTVFIVPLYTAVRLTNDAVGVATYTVTVVCVSNRPIAFASLTKFVVVLKIAVVTTPNMPNNTVVTTLKLLRDVLKFGRALRTLVVTLCVTVSDFKATYGIANSKTVTIIMSGVTNGRGAKADRP